MRERGVMVAVGRGSTYLTPRWTSLRGEDVGVPEEGTLSPSVGTGDKAAACCSLGEGGVREATPMSGWVFWSLPPLELLTTAEA